ncbi:hypothetical protein QTP88_000394 [Uroleucon formosanum]
MDVNDRNLVTAPGDSDPQVPAAVGGSGVKAGSNVAGSLRSLSNDRESTGVASQAPATLTITSAEAGSGPDGVAIVMAWKTLKGCLKTHDAGIKMLMVKAKNLENCLARVRSPDVKSAIEEALQVVVGVTGSRSEVAKAANSMTTAIQRVEQQQISKALSCNRVCASTQTKSSEANPVSGVCVGTQIIDKELQQQNKQQLKQQQQQHQATWIEVVKRKKKGPTTQPSPSPPTRPPTAANGKLAMLQQRAPKPPRPPGIDIPGWGNSSAVEYIVPSLFTFGAYFKSVGDTLVGTGLERDVSIRGAPYDFRKAPSDDLGIYVLSGNVLKAEQITSPSLA